VTASPTIVQFLHPGREHIANGRLMEWNRGAHRRKFIRNRGTCVRGSERRVGDLAFWGSGNPSLKWR
jgi:hypothetical protein